MERFAELDETTAEFEANAFGASPNEFAGSADPILLGREFHNITSAKPNDALALVVLGEIVMLLKAKGVLSILQHFAPKNVDPERCRQALANGENSHFEQNRFMLQ